MTTLTQPLEISVLSAPLAAIDRRALSQAWYSALGFARNSTGGGERPTSFERRVNAPRSQGGRSGAEAERARALDARSERPRERRGPLASASADPRAERVPRELALPHDAHRDERRTERLSRSKLAQQIERKLLRKGHEPARTTLTIDGERGRVHLMLQRHAGRLRIIAICPKRLQREVARALEEARCALCM